MGNTISIERSQTKAIQPSSPNNIPHKQINKIDTKVEEVKAVSLTNIEPSPEPIPPLVRLVNLNKKLKESFNLELIYQKARCLIVELDKFDKGLEECQKLLNYGEDSTVRILTAMAYLGLGQIENGEQTVGLLREMKLDKDQEGLITLLQAEIAFQKKEFTEALALIEQARGQTDTLAAESAIIQAKVHNALNNEEQELKSLEPLAKILADTFFVSKGKLRLGELYIKNNQAMKAGLCYFGISSSNIFPFSWSDKIHKEPLAFYIREEARQEMQKGNFLNACALLFHALKTLPDASWAYPLFLECGVNLKETRDLPNEHDYINTCKKEIPDNPWLNLRIAEIRYCNSKRFSGGTVWPHLQKFLYKYSDSPFIFHDRRGMLCESLFMAYLSGGTFEKETIKSCLEKLQKMQAHQSRQPMPIVKIAMYVCLFILDDLDKIVNKLLKEINTKKIKDAVGMYLAHALLGIVALKNNEFKASNRFFSAIMDVYMAKKQPLTNIKDRPEDEVICLLAWIETSLYINKKRNDFIEIVDNILNEHPKNAYAKFIKGILLFHDNNRKESIASLDEALALRPSSPFAGAAYYYKAIQQPEEYEKLIKKAFELRYAKAVIPYCDGIIKEGRIKEAAGLLTIFLNFLLSHYSLDQDKELIEKVKSLISKVKNLGETSKKKEETAPSNEHKKRSTEIKEITRVEAESAILQPNFEPDTEVMQAIERNNQKEDRIKADLERAEKKREIEQLRARILSREQDWFGRKRNGEKQQHPSTLAPLFVKGGHPHSFNENKAKKRCLEIMRKESGDLFTELQRVEEPDKPELENFSPQKKHPVSDVKEKKSDLSAFFDDNDLFSINSAKLACVSLIDTLNRSSQTEIFKNEDKAMQMANSLLYNLLKLFDFLNDKELEPALAHRLHGTFLKKDTIHLARNALRHNFIASGSLRIFQLARKLVEGKAKERLENILSLKTKFPETLDQEVLPLVLLKEGVVETTPKEYFAYLHASLDEFEVLAKPFVEKLGKEILEQDSDSLHALKMTIAKMCECLRHLKNEQKILKKIEQKILKTIVNYGNRIAHEKGDNPFNFEDIHPSQVWQLIQQADALRGAVAQLGKQLRYHA